MVRKYFMERIRGDKASMKRSYKIALFVIILINTVLVIVNLVFLLMKINSENNETENSEYQPLFVTPYLKDGKNDEARYLSQVFHSKFHNVESYSGYLTVNEDTDSHMFFWYFPSDKYASTAPLVLWLQGGPATSALYGLFAEIGPFEAISTEELILRQYSWHEDFNLLFLDNPVGAGFSLTKNGYVRNQTEVGRDLYTAMLQFFQLFPDLENRQFYVSGESYAGKFVPALAYTIHQNNNKADLKINLQGVIIGNGLSDPINQINYADYLFQLGLVDQNQRNFLSKIQENCLQLYEDGKYEEAFKVYSDLIFEAKEHTPHGSHVRNMTGFKDNYNYLESNGKDLKYTFWSTFVTDSEIRKALHADLNKKFQVRSMSARKRLYEDVLRSVSFWIAELLSYYRVLIYNGQMDIRVAYPLTKNFLNNLNFSAAEDYAKAPRYKWFVEDELAGYWKTAGNLTEVLVRNAGHMAPRDQPKWVYNLVSKFINNEILS